MTGMALADRGYANPGLLITPDELAALLRADGAAVGDPEWRPPPLVLDCRAADAFAGGHIAGAAHFDPWGLSLIDTDAAPLRAFLWMIHHALALRGVREDRPVVIVDTQTGLRAARVFWFLEYFGHGAVRVLDGGMDAWRRAGHPLSVAPVAPVPATWTDTPRPDVLATWCDVLAAIGRPDTILLDTRSDDEYVGVLVRARRGGAIPGAVHVEWTRALDDEGRYLPGPALRMLYEAAGVTPDREIITYCQGAYRAAHSYLALRLLGYPRLRVYLGSWKEWGDRDETPVELPRP